MAKDAIVIKGAREHNLKGIDVELPRNQLVVITGISGSGKSSLAFDTLYAEGQRRYVESLSAYARQFLGQMEKPEVDYIEGLSPAISIDQKTTSKNPRSTVGTITEIYDYMRVLFANVGIPHCPNDGSRVEAQTPQQIVEKLAAFPDGTKLQILAPVVKDRKGEYKKLFKDLAQQGFQRVRVNGVMGDIQDDWKLGRYDKHTVEVVVDRIAVKDGDAETRDKLTTRLTDSVEQALKLGEGHLTALEGDVVHDFSEHFACNQCGFSLPELVPRVFSFNSPHGACDACSGLGFSLEVDPAVVVVDTTKPLSDGAFHPTVLLSSPWLLKELEHVARAFGFKMRQPWDKLTARQQAIVLNGSDQEIAVKYQSKSGSFVWEGTEAFEGIVPRLERYYRDTESEGKRDRIQALMAQRACKACTGSRLKPGILGVTIGGSNIAALTATPVGRLRTFFEALEDKLTDRERHIAHEVVKEIRERLRFMVDVGLDYLTLDRSSATLSGGESQRIRLATQIGSGLVGVLYILDEPSIGLHQRDNQRLIRSLKGLRDLGNTLIVVEHDEEMIRSADWVLDLGPGAGEHGGEIVSQGTPAQVQRDKNSITGGFLSGRDHIPVPAHRRPGNGKRLIVRGARENNLKNVDADVPLGVFTCITGVSGSGKSTLINDILYKALARKLNRANEAPGLHDRLDGVENVDKVIIIDQSPIGRTPRSNPATYTGVFTPIRELFARTPDAKVRGFEKGRFSFNVRGGRCEACEGDGMVQIEMHFLADVYVPCDVCKGARYNRETLAVKYKGKSIRDVLDMTVEEAFAFFKDVPSIHRTLATLLDVGLTYMRLGQSATTLSGGEAQRVKLATELQKRPTGKTVYILDEPTTGLHFADIQKLLGVLDRLASTGNSVIVIEHNLDVIKCADWILDLGPEGGERGGELVAVGTPETVAQTKGSYTGEFLAPLVAPTAPRRAATTARSQARAAARPATPGEPAAAEGAGTKRRGRGKKSGRAAPEPGADTAGTAASTPKKPRSKSAKKAAPRKAAKGARSKAATKASTKPAGKASARRAAKAPATAAKKPRARKAAATKASTKRTRAQRGGSKRR